MRKLLCLGIILLLFSCLSWATTYYVSNSGSDSANGTTTSTPWAHSPGMSACGSTCAGVTLLAGDSVLFQCGGTWRGNSITGLPTVGSPGYTFGNYGGCEAVRPTPNVTPLPKITGSTALTNASFTLSAGKTFTYQIALTTNPGNFSAESGTPLLFQSSIATVEATACTFWWSSNVYYVHPCASGNPTTNGKVYETATQFDALSATPFMTVDGLDLEFGTSFVINADVAQHFTLKNSIVRLGAATGQAIWVESGPTKSSNQTYTGNDFSYSNDVLFLYGDNLVITGNVMHDAVRCTEIQDVAPFSQNIRIGLDASGNIASNYYHDCGAQQGNPQNTGETNAGILINGSTNGTNSAFNQGQISYNFLINMHGRPYDGFMGNSTISYNVAINTQAGASSGDAIVWDLNGPNINLFNNTALNWTNMCIQVETTPVSGNVASNIKNNICANYSGAQNWFAYVTNAAAPPVFANNFYWDNVGGAGQSKYSWETATKTFATWVTASSSTGEQEVIPGLANPISLNARLSNNSPALNAGLNLGTTYQMGLNSHSVFPFAQYNQNLSGSGWDIGAFVFLPGNAWMSSGAK